MIALFHRRLPDGGAAQVIRELSGEWHDTGNSKVRDFKQHHHDGTISTNEVFLKVSLLPPSDSEAPAASAHTTLPVPDSSSVPIPTMEAWRQDIWTFRQNITDDLSSAAEGKTEHSDRVEKGRSTLATYDHDFATENTIQTVKGTGATLPSEKERRAMAARRATEPYRASAIDVLAADVMKHRAATEDRVKAVEAQLCAMNKHITTVADDVYKNVKEKDSAPKKDLQLAVSAQAIAESVMADINHLKRELMEEREKTKDSLTSMIDNIQTQFREAMWQCEKANAHNLRLFLRLSEFFSLSSAALADVSVNGIAVCHFLTQFTTQTEHLALAVGMRTDREDAADTLLHAFRYSFSYIASFKLESAVSKNIAPDAGLSTVGFLTNVKKLYKLFKKDGMLLLEDLMEYPAKVADLKKKREVAMLGKNYDDLPDDIPPEDIDGLFRFFVARLHGTLEFHYLMYLILKHHVMFMEAGIREQLKEGKGSDLSKAKKGDDLYIKIGGDGPLSVTTDNSTGSEKRVILDDLADTFESNLGFEDGDDSNVTFKVLSDEGGFRAMLDVDYDGPEDIPMRLHTMDKYLPTVEHKKRKKKKGTDSKPETDEKLLFRPLNGPSAIRTVLDELQNHAHTVFKGLSQKQDAEDIDYLQRMEHQYYKDLDDEIPLGLLEGSEFTRDCELAKLLVRLRGRRDEHRERSSYLYNAIMLILLGVAEEVCKEEEPLRSHLNRLLHDRAKPIDLQTYLTLFKRASDNLGFDIPAERKAQIIAMAKLMRRRELYGREIDRQGLDRDIFDIVVAERKDWPSQPFGLQHYREWNMEKQSMYDIGILSMFRTALCKAAMLHPNDQVGDAFVEALRRDGRENENVPRTEGEGMSGVKGKGKGKDIPTSRDSHATRASEPGPSAQQPQATSVSEPGPSAHHADTTRTRAPRPSLTDLRQKEQTFVQKFNDSLLFMPAF